MLDYCPPVVMNPPQLCSGCSCFHYHMTSSSSLSLQLFFTSETFSWLSLFFQNRPLHSMSHLSLISEIIPEMTPLASLSKIHFSCNSFGIWIWFWIWFSLTALVKVIQYSCDYILEYRNSELIWVSFFYLLHDIFWFNTSFRNMYNLLCVCPFNLCEWCLVLDLAQFFLLSLAYTCIVKYIC